MKIRASAMTTRPRPIQSFKLLWQRLLSSQPAEADQLLAAVVYRRLRGQLSILLLENKRGVWLIPIGYSLVGELPDAALARLIKEAAGIEDLKVWQSLGRSREPASLPARSGPLPGCFLVQALSGFEQLVVGKQWRSAAWLTVDEALDRLQDEGDARIVLIAAAKLKRAQI